MVVLLAPHGTSLSGGYLYNQHIAAELPAERFRYLQLPYPPQPRQLADLAVPADAALLLDSLYFAFPDWIEELAHAHRGSLAMLVHYLPSLDPTAAPPAAGALRKAEIRCLSCCDHIIVPSRYLQSEVHRLIAQLSSRSGASGSSPGRRGSCRDGRGSSGGRGPSSPAVSVAQPGAQKTDWRGAAGDPDGRVSPRSNSEKAALQLLTVANWTAAKNHAFLLPQLQEFKQLNWIWRIFGQADESGVLVAEFKRKAAVRSLSDRIQIGPQISPEEVARQLRRADLFLYPSRFESYGMVLAEALYAGVPVIANRTGGIPEAVGDGPAAVLCNGGDEFSLRGEWHQALKELLTDKDTREQMRRAAAHRARKLPSWSTTAAAVMAALEHN